MRTFSKVFLLAVAFGGMLTACSPDKVAPQNETPTLGKYAETEHPRIEPVCSDTINCNLRSANGSYLVNYQCTSNCPQWGSVQVINSPDTLAAYFAMAPGWFIDASASYMTLASNIGVDPVSMRPILTNDYVSVDVNPLVNRWTLFVSQDSIEKDANNCFGMACNLTVTKLSFFGGSDVNSRRVLWMSNPEYNVPGSAYESSSEFILPWCWQNCAPPAPDTLAVTSGSCEKCETEITVTFNGCGSANVSALCKDLSNIVVGYSDCSTVKYDGLTTRNLDVTAPAGLSISAVWVKTGCNASGICPGCGTQFDNPNTQCATTPGCTYVFN